MKVLSEYILCAFLASLAAGVAEKLSSSSGSLKKYVSFIASLVLLVMLVKPLGTLVDLLSDFAEGSLETRPSEGEEEKDYGYLLETTEKKVAEAIGEDLTGAFDLSEPPVISVELVLEEGGTILMVKIDAGIPVAYSDRKANIKEYLETKYHTAVSVTVKGG